MLRIGLFVCLKNSLIIYDFWVGVLRTRQLRLRCISSFYLIF